MNLSLPDEMLARMGYELIAATGLLPIPCKTWRDRPAANQTFQELQTFFNNEISNYESNSPTSSSQGYANSTENIQNIIHNNELQTIIFTQHNPDIFNSNQENDPPTDPSPEPAPAPTQASANSSEVLSELKNLVNALTSQSHNNNNNNNNNSNNNK